jgi:serine/threonine protein kinase/Tol biopolymer transport system component
VSETLSPDTIIGQYRILSKIGEGGMGEVYLAEDSRLRRKVALKVLPENLAGDKERWLRFEREAHSVSALNHPNILTIHEFGAHGSTHYLAAEFVQGETLRARLKRLPISLPEALDIAIQIASALQAAHEGGIIHRDIKPENVMIREDGYVKVLDFGLAKLSEQRPADGTVNAEAETRAQLQTQAGVIMGTVAYMSPEQARGNAVDARTDIFSLGAVLYEMLTGDKPFTGETVSHIIVAVIEKEAPRLSASGKQFPIELEKIIDRTLAKQLNQRYQSAKALLADLKSLQTRLVVDAEIERASAAGGNGEVQTQIIATEAAGGGSSGLLAKAMRANFTLAHYRIVSKIGAGGMGEVFLATDTRLNRKVALKLLPVEFTNDNDRLRRFQQEAQTASALNHPNIITIYEIGAENGVNFIATEFIEGQTLRQKMREGLLPLNEALAIAQQVMSAFVAAHEAGIVHRDIKPENIMVRPDGLAKVLDFGLAKLAAPVGIDNEAQTAIQGLTRPGIVLGTRHYMSPEQVRGLPLDARSDVFSLGTVLYEMLTGQGPFDRPTKGDVIAAILTENPPPLSQLKPGVPAELQRILAKALQKDKENRYQTSKDLLIDIRSLNRELEFTSQMGNTTEAATGLTSPLRTRRFSSLQVIGIVLLVSLVIGAVWWFAVKRNPQATTSLPSSWKTAEVFSWRSTPGEVYSLGAFSPDGMRVAFVSNSNGTRNIQVKQTSANAPPVQTTKDEFNNDYPIWSPDGEEIAFFSLRGHQQGIWRVPYLGGSPTLITTVAAGDMKPRLWSKTGVLYYEAQQNLFAFDMKAGQTTQLTNFEAATTTAHSLSISADEKRIAYIMSAGNLWNVWTTPARGGGTPTQLFGGALEIRNTIWHPDSRRVLFSLPVDGVFQIFATDVDGSKPLQITLNDKDSLALDVSADGAKILYGSSKEESDVWGVSVASAEEFALTSDINSELWPNISPDSKTVAFQSIRNLSQGDNLSSGAILTKPTDPGLPATQLVTNGFLPMWSPDGKQLAFMRLAGDSYNLWTIKTTGGAEQQLTKAGMAAVQYSVLPYSRPQASHFSWSPDSKLIAYPAKRGGSQNIWLVAADGSSDTPLTNNSDPNLLLQSPLWSVDGKYVAYTAKSNQVVNGKVNYVVGVADANTKETKVILQAKSELRLLGWSRDSKGLILATVNGKVATLSEVTFLEIAWGSGEQRTISTQPATYRFNIHLSADRQMIAFVSQQDGKDNIWVIPATGGSARMLTQNRDSRLYFSSLAWSPDGKAIFFGKQSRYSLLSMITNFK